MKYCQGPRCHTYDTTDRKRGAKGNKRNQTRTIGTYGYGNGNFCTLGCQDDWWKVHGTQAVDYFGRIHQPKVLTEEEAWQRVWNRARYDNENLPDYIERNTITGEERPYTG
tara:strand:+ start:436 stop:768 length:333 start_codon:yes stop_codon:yes gene_type:complete